MQPVRSEAQDASGEAVARRIDSAAERLSEAAVAVGEVIFGQAAVVEQAMVTMVADGHGLLVGVPGLGKTLLVETLSRVFGLDRRRVQFTPDLMPTDILGSEILDEDGNGRHFRYVEGPVFTQLLMADEINRASPRTQSALLQAMQERQVSVGGHPRSLPRPFHVLATQNPIEQEGTYPLPEAQLDRFLLQIDVDYPDIDTEKTILLKTTGGEGQEARPVVSPAELLEVQELARLMPIGETVLAAILDLVRRGRPETTKDGRIAEWVAWGPGPRAGQALMRCTRARALLQGRLSPSVEDVVALAEPVLRHRMALSYAARAEGIDVDHVVARLAAPLG
ncbi:MAG: MoxR family ATPase [Alphaproteobacteria bacterium]|nr:MoxR family ATPase [Alphaproteobacteria bacterium]